MFSNNKVNIRFLRFCVLVAGFVSRTLNHKGLFEKMLKDDHMKVTIPTLHVLGDTDRYAIMSLDYCDYCNMVSPL